MTLLSTIILGTATATLLLAVPGVGATIINTTINELTNVAVLLCIFMCIDIFLTPILPLLPCVVCAECIILLCILLSDVRIQIIITTMNMIVYTIIGIGAGIAGSYLTFNFVGSLYPRSLSIIPIITVISAVAGGLIGVPVGAAVTTIINLPGLIVSPLSAVSGIFLWPVSGAAVGALSGVGCGFVGAIASLRKGGTVARKIFGRKIVRD